MFEVNEHVLLDAFVERAKVGWTEPKQVAAHKVMDILIDELPVKSVVPEMSVIRPWQFPASPFRKSFLTRIGSSNDSVSARLKQLQATHQ
jgi:hypothetical protein